MVTKITERADKSSIRDVREYTIIYTIYINIPEVLLR